MLYGGYFIYVICAAVFLTCSQQRVMDVLAVTSLDTCTLPYLCLGELS